MLSKGLSRWNYKNYFLGLQLFDKMHQSSSWHNASINVTPFYQSLSIKSKNLNRYPQRTMASQVVSVVKNLLANAGDIRDMGSIPGSGRSPGGGHGNPLQCSCLENPMDRGVGYSPRGRKESDTTEVTWHGTHTYACFFLLSVYPFIHTCPSVSHCFSLSTQ